MVESPNSVTLARRRFLRLAAGVAALPAVWSIARAHSYPTRPVRWIVPFPAGGFPDIVARLIGQYLTERFGQPFVVENRPGAAGNIGTEAAIRAPPDGYTLLSVGQPSAINATLYARLNFDFMRDIIPIAGIVRTPVIMVVHPSFPAKTVPEFVAFARANPGKINFGSGGIGSTSHVIGELFRMMAGVDMLHVPYRGAAPALTDLLGGQVQLMFDNITSSIEYVRSGKLRGLAVTTAARSRALPNLPTVGDFLPGFEVSNWSGLGAPRSTSAEIVGLLNSEINTALTDVRIKARLSDLDGTILAGSAADFGRLVVEETEKWAKVIRFANIKSG